LASCAGAQRFFRKARGETQLQQFIEITVPRWFDRRVLPVTQAIAERWGVLDAQSQAAGRPLGVTDGMIAATALEHGLDLVTRNVKDFGGLGIVVFNPWQTS
jgi:predicted nucleic acid-binding protein